MRSHIVVAAALLVAYQLPAFAAEGLSGATVRADSAQQSPERKAMRERCQADPEKCRAEMRARREKWCADNPDRCREMKARMEQRREQCKANPETCRQEMQERREGHFKRADTDGNGMLSRTEAEKAMPRLARHFDQIDTNRDG